MGGEDREKGFFWMREEVEGIHDDVQLCDRGIDGWLVFGMEWDLSSSFTSVNIP